ANIAGQVTYRNGTVVYVNGAAATAAQATVVAPGAPGAVPLTIGLLSTPGAANLYFANPDPTSGAIDAGSVSGRILSGQGNAAGINANGPILTGATHLPISALQLDAARAGIAVPGTIVATRVGDKTSGYPEYSANFTANYRFPGEGWLRGLSVGGSLILGWKSRSYYYYATPLTRANALTLPRTLLYAPDRRQANVFASYARKFGRFEWNTQLNVANVFDTYERVIMPDAATGFNNLTNLRVTWYGQPRTWQWTNSIKF
ncbi:MAG: TonB-dependent receptor, partial [Verrucomicrobia bacterium]|nr:TonB-dependent receptor [Verrucomicrobiota bacterium]